MTNDGPRFDELLPAYALGALDGEDLAEVERRLAAGDPEAERELARLARDLELLAETTAPVTPSEATRARVLRQAGRSAVFRGSGSPGAVRWLAAAAALLLAVSGWSQWSLRQRIVELARLNGQIERQLVETRTSLELARRQLDDKILETRIVASPDRIVVPLDGLEGAVRASADTFINPRLGKAVFYAYNLPELSPDLTYQLWFITDGTPVSAGIFDVGAGGVGTLLVERLADLPTIQLWAVTIEPAGGVERPTLENMVLKQVA